MSKILVTGAGGFIGSHLSKSLVENGFEVIGLDNINAYYDVNLKYGRLRELGLNKEIIQKHSLCQSEIYPQLSFVKADLLDLDFLNELFLVNKFEIVINLAAQAGVRYSIDHPREYIKSNVEGFFNILDVAKENRVKHFFYASSSSVYGGNSATPYKEDDKVDTPYSLYAATKKSNELLAHSYSHIHNLSTTGLRFFTVYGPWGRPDMATYLFTKAILNKKTIKLFNGGNLYRDFTYIDDVVEAVTRLVIDSAAFTPHLSNMGVTQHYRILNIGNSSPIKLTEMLHIIESNLGEKAEIEFEEMQPGDVFSTFADTKELDSIIGFTPNTPFSIGIKEFIKWYKRFYNVR